MGFEEKVFQNILVKGENIGHHHYHLPHLRKSLLRFCR